MVLNFCVEQFESTEMKLEVLYFNENFRQNFDASQEI